MTPVLALALVFLLAAAVIVASYEQLRRRERGWERREQGWERERRELVDRIMFLSEKTWTPPPVDVQPRDWEPDEALSDEFNFDPMYVLPNETV